MSNTLTHTLSRRALAALLLTILCTAARAQQAATPPSAKEPATVSGRVTTSDGRPAREVPVVLMPAEWLVQMEPIAKGVTDEEGRYKLTDVKPGRYHLTAISPGYVFAEAGANEWQPGKVVNVSSGDELKNLDFTLVRGGVVTGRVTDPDGKPVIEESVVLLPADKSERKQGGAPNTSAATDDRGVYRAWGVKPGRYLVYAGRSREDNLRRGAGAGAFYPQTFYPSVGEESQAKVVEVAAGVEADDVDITLSKLEMTYAARGRVVDEEGRPVQNVSVALGSMTKGGRRFSGNVEGGMKTDERGEFTVRGLTPGDWGVWATEGEIYGGGSQGANYSDPAVFEVTDSDVSGLEVKMRRGAEVSGVVTLEGTSDPAIIARFKEARFGAWVNTGDASAGVPNYTSFQPAADGSFSLKGLRPGRLTLDLEWGSPKGFSLLYIKREGVELREGLEVRAGERVKNVQAVYAYGTSVIRGEVQFRGGVRQEGVTYLVRASRPQSGGTGGESDVIDSLGRFKIENLSAGEYELTLTDWSPVASNRSPLAKLNVTVPAEGEVKVTLVYDMTPKKEGP